MKTTIYTAFFFLILVTNANASVIDAPHNDANAISCGDCHSYSIWWSYSPLSKSDPAYASFVDSICLNCHDGIAVIGDPCGHSGDAMEEMHNPDIDPWSTKCVDCHDPHFQNQLYWRTGYSSDLYLVTGTIGDNSTFTYPNDSTTFSYHFDGALFDWGDPILWGKKNNTVPERGLIFVVDPTNAEETFQVNTADNSTITVKGSLDLGAASKTFGLIYGQLIKSSIETPTGPIRDVQFFNPYDAFEGFVKTTIPTEGLCQVCHTQTTYWDSNSTDTSHWSGIVCTTCHIPSKGFKPHNVSVTGNSCDACHSTIDTFNDVISLHLGSCDTCHSSTRQDVNDAISSGGSTCISCHSESSVHQAVYYFTDQVDMPFLLINENGSNKLEKAYLPFGGVFP